MSRRIVRPAVKIKQGNLIIFATSFKVRDLIRDDFYNIDRLDPQNLENEGYQRLLNRNRAKKLADYIIAGQDKQDAFLPTSIFMAIDKSINFNENNNTIDFDLDNIGSFSVVDGQHRIEGLKMAAEKDERVLDFEIPVNIAVNLDNISQMAHFLIVNTTQKGVDEGLAQRIRERLTGMVDVEVLPSLPQWIENMIKKQDDKNALRFVDYLNTAEDSPWQGKITMANEVKKQDAINQKSFVTLMKKHFLLHNNPLIYGDFSEDKQLKIFLNYWKAIINIIEPSKTSVLYKYNGVCLFCMFGVPFMSRLVNSTDFTVKTMQKLLEDIFENASEEALGIGYEDFWRKGGKAGGFNATALNKICTNLVKTMSSLSMQGQEIEL
ncbi:MAG: DGQHR domain-containing protein [Cyanobacteria bacterium SIG28]|nr:DGQHR domain-containing protein [Cyanobacteria bacterium SIG28]